MKPVSKPFVIKMVFGVSILFAAFFLAPDARAQSVIQGTIYDKQRNRLPNIEVELLNDYYQTIKRTRTDGAGMYSFGGLTNGRYTVRAYAFRYDLEDQEIPVEINTQNIRGGEGVGYFPQDFYLLPKKGGLKEAELSVVFAQEIPKEAQTLYEKAVKDISDKRTDEGILGLREAIRVFPEYYLALYRFGYELFLKGQYLDSVPVLLKAIDVNPKSPTSFYYLAHSLHNLGEKYRKSALTAINQAYIMAPGSTPVLLLLGQIERAAAKFTEAEKHLLQAKKLSTSKNPDIHWELALLYGNNLKKYKEAADELELYLKASKLADEAAQKTKKLIAEFREKAKNPTSN